MKTISKISHRSLNTSAIKPLLLLLLVVGPLSLYSQKENTDNQVWTSAAYSLDLGKNWRFEIEEQLRFSQTLSGMEESFTEVGMRYEVTSDFSLKGQYRYNIIVLERNEHRVSLDLDYEWDDWDFPVSIENRLRIQDATVSYTGEKTTKVRGRFGLVYEVNDRNDVYAEYESYFTLNDENAFSRNRYTLGYAWEISEWFEFEIFGRYQYDLNEDEPEYERIIGLGISYGMDWEHF